MDTQHIDSIPEIKTSSRQIEVDESILIFQDTQ